MDNLVIMQLASFVLSLVLGFFIIPHMMLRSTPKKARFIGQKSESEGVEGILLSGISFFLITLIASSVSLSIPYIFDKEHLVGMTDDSVMRLLQLFIGGSLLFLVGLKDDLNGTTDFVKFFTLLLVAVLLPATGCWIDNLGGLFGLYDVPAYIGMPLTIILVMYITEAFSLLDGLDGLSCGFGFLLLLVLCVLGAQSNCTLFSFAAVSAFGVATVLCLLTWFKQSWKHTMMGNSGAYVLGYIVSSQVIGVSQGVGGENGTLMICFGALILPMLDVMRVVGSRIRDGRNIESPDRNQFNYKLLRTGLHVRYIPMVIALLLAMFVALNVVGVYLELNYTLLLVIDIVLWIVMQYSLNWRIHAFEQAHHKEEWNKLYGKEAWDSNIPHEVMRHKIETYGTMGLPQHMQCGNPIEFIPDGMTGFGRSTKRLWDFFLSGCCLVAFSPLFLLCYLLIKMDDGGPAIYSQERIGRFGRPFYIYKFRSMRMDAEKNGPALSHANGEEDPRLTKVGRFLREHHLDELPQLWNVLMGDMAFIGYRPERKYFIDKIMQEDPRYAFLYQIRPGVTSYATLYNGYTDTMAKMLRRLELDLYYLRNRSWWFDCKVLFLTFTSIVFGKKF